METLSSSPYGFAATHSRAKRKNDRRVPRLAVVDTLGQSDTMSFEAPGSPRRHRWPVCELLNYSFSGGAALRVAAFEVQQNEAAQLSFPFGAAEPITWTKMQARRPWAGRSAPCLV